MDKPTNASTDSSSLSQYIAQQATQQATVDSIWLHGKLGNQGAMNILYEATPNGQGDFSVSSLGLLSNTLLIQATPEQKKTLLEALRAEEHNPPSGLDVPVLRAFIHLLAQSVEDQPSTRFANARFGEIVQDMGGAIVGHCTLGVDVVGTLHDTHGLVTFEQHVVPMPPGRFRHISTADRASLINALEDFIKVTPAASPLWSQVLQDLHSEGGDK